MKKIFLILIGLIFVTFLSAKSLWKDKSLYTDKKAHKIGDIVTIMISESASASSSVSNSSSEEEDFSASVGPHSGELNFLPLFGSSATGENEYSGQGDIGRSNNFAATITARVVDVLSNGNLLLEGHREVMINGEKEIIKISGIARSDDITSDNNIKSKYLADAKISYSGKGTMTNGAKPGFIVKLFNWLF